MSGLGGHISHLHEDLSLTFDDLREVLTRAAEGDLECYEKFDGMNLFASGSGSGTRFARNKSDLLSGGMTVADVRERFAGRGSVEVAFVEGARALASSSIDIRDWTSLEVIHECNPNVIKYDYNAIVLHQNVPLPKKCPPGWRILGPTRVTLTPVPVKTHRSALKKFGSLPGASLRDYVGGRLQADVRELGVAPAVASRIVDRCLGDPGASLQTIRTMVDKSTYLTISQFVQDSRIRIRQHLQPVEEAVYSIAAAALSGCTSALVNDSLLEQRRIRADFLYETLQVGMLGTEAERARSRSFVDLKTLCLDVAPIEGVVFDFCGKTYKMTGAFAHINQTMGARKYSR